MNKITVGNLIEYGIEALDFEVCGGESGLKKDLVGTSTLIYEGGNTPSAIPGGTILIFAPSEMPVDEPDGTYGQAMLLAESAGTSLIVCSQIDIPSPLIEFAEEKSIVLVRSGHDPHYVKSRVLAYLKMKIEGKTELQGVLAEEYGLGVFIRGESGIGKSECGMELVARGHTFIADDLVELRRDEDGTLRGRSPDSIQYLMAIRGLGVFNVKEVFGDVAVRDETTVGIIVELVQWEGDGIRLSPVGVSDRHHRILEVDIPVVKIPVRTGGSMATIVEVIARTVSKTNSV